MTNITGTASDDNGTDRPALIGTAEDDVIAGLGGDDLIEGLAGNDFLSPAFGTDTVLGGAGDDRVLHSGGPRGMTGLWDGGDGFDRLILQALTQPAIFTIEHLDFRNFERIDLNGHRLILTVSQLQGIEQITGFGAMGGLEISGGGTVDLGRIIPGDDGTATGSIRSEPSSAGTSFVWDASGSDTAWNMLHYTYRPSMAGTMLGGTANDNLRGRQGDTLRGGAGDDTLDLYGSGFGHFSVVDGGEGHDTFVSIGADYSRSLFENIEVFSGSGFLRAAALNSFEGFERVGTLGMATPGTVDLSGRITSVVQTSGQTRAPVFNFNGSDAADTITWTDTRFRINLNAALGHDTVTTGDGNDLLQGGGGNDVIRSGDGADVITGGDGDDTIIAWGSDADVGDRVEGDDGSDSIEGGAGNDVLAGSSFFDANRSTGNDTIDGGDGADRILGSGGDDLLIGGTSDADLADVIDGNNGHDRIFGGAGNDSVNGGTGNDTIEGGTGADTLAGNAGDDHISGGALADLIFGNDGDDFINGGFGSDRISLGAGADRVYHAGVAGHGSDWIQDFTAEDALVAFDGARAEDFQLNIATTANAGAADVAEAFVIWRPTGQILWALVDGAGQGSISLMLGDQVFDLMA